MKRVIFIVFITMSLNLFASTKVILGTKVSSTETYHMKSIEYLDLSTNSNKIYDSSWDFRFSPMMIKENGGQSNASINEVYFKRLLMKDKAVVKVGRDNTWVLNEMLSLDGIEYVHYFNNYKSTVRVDAGRLVNKSQFNEEELEGLGRVRYYERSLVKGLNYSLEFLNYNEEFGTSYFARYSLFKDYFVSGKFSRYGGSNDSYSLRTGRGQSFIEFKRDLAVIISNDETDLAFNRLFKINNDDYFVLNVYEFDGVFHVKFLSSRNEDNKYQIDVSSKIWKVSPYYKRSRKSFDRQDILGISSRIHKDFKLNIGEGLIKTKKRNKQEIFQFVELDYETIFRNTHLISMGIDYLDNDEWIHDDLRFSLSYARKY